MRSAARLAAAAIRADLDPSVDRIIPSDFSKLNQRTSSAADGSRSKPTRPIAMDTPPPRRRRISTTPLTPNTPITPLTPITPTADGHTEEDTSLTETAADADQKESESTDHTSAAAPNSANGGDRAKGRKIETNISPLARSPPTTTNESNGRVTRALTSSSHSTVASKAASASASASSSRSATLVQTAPTRASTSNGSAPPTTRSRPDIPRPMPSSLQRTKQIVSEPESDGSGDQDDQNSSPRGSVSASASPPRSRAGPGGASMSKRVSEALSASVDMSDLLDLLLPTNVYEYYDMWYKRRTSESNSLLKLGVDIAGFSFEAESFVHDLLTQASLARYEELEDADPHRTFAEVNKCMIDMEETASYFDKVDVLPPNPKHNSSTSRQVANDSASSIQSMSPIDGIASPPVVKDSPTDDGTAMTVAAAAGHSNYMRKKREALDLSVRMETSGIPCRLVPQPNLIEKIALRDGFNVDEYAFPRDTDERFREGTYVNCDLRYFNLSCLGKFDVVMIDPPWRIRGGEREMGEQTLFSNTSFKHEYYTLSNQEILDIDIGALSTKGLIFLWVINSQMPFAFECLNKWGYEYLDRVMWIKTTKHQNIAIGPGYHFLHSTEICLVGFKCPRGETTQFIGKVNNDIIFAPVRDKSRKPDQIYHIIERMAPGSRKVEVFARNHNLRKGWLSLGNQLGEYYDYTRDHVSCNGCENDIRIAQTRYKSRTDGEADYCHKCFQSKKLNENDFFVLKNAADTMIFHEYYQCDECGSDPLPGMRFHCSDCEEFDLCEWCYDKMMAGEDVKCMDHKHHRFEVVEMPEKAAGYQVHYERCASCQQYPIIGVRAYCNDCYLSMCQKCFYMKREPKSHLSTHEIKLVVVPQDDEEVHKQVRCDVCTVFPIVGARYACNTCYRYNICSQCHDEKAPTSFRFPSHKSFHTYTKIV